MTAPVNPFASHVKPDEGPLYLMTYDHAVGYPHIQDEARKTIAMVEANPEFKTGSQVEGWTWDWLAKNDPGFVNEARGWIARYNGRWLPDGGSYGQPYLTFVSEESVIRQIFYGTRALKEHLGYDNDIYIYSEHETTPQLPQILAGMGYRGAILRTHMQYGGDGPACDADWVLWTGPDGSSIPAVPAYSGLEQCWGNMWLMTGQDGWATWANMDAFKVEMRHRGVRNPLVSRCDDWGTRPHPKLLQRVKEHPTNAHWVTAGEYFDLLEASGIEPAPFQAMPNDFIPEQPWGYCGNTSWTGPRVASSRALTAEAVAATAILKGFHWTPAHQARLDEAWKNLLIAEHHDSVAAGIYKEGRDFTDPSMNLSQDLARETAGFLAAKTQAQGDALFVFNPTGHPRSEAVFLPASGPVRVIAPDGAPVASQDGPAGPCFVARDVPAMGYKVYRLEPGAPATSAAAAPGEATGFETGRYRVAFGLEGGLVTLHDKLTGRDLVKDGARTGLLDGIVGSRFETSRGRARLTYNGPDVWRAVEIGKVGAIAYEMTYTFTGDNARIDLDILLTVPFGTRIGCPDPKDPDRPNRGGERDHAVKLRYVFDARLEEVLGKAPRAVRHQPLVVQTAPPDDEILFANLWASVETEKSGLAIANTGSMGYRAAGSSLEPILAYSGDHSWGGPRLMEGMYAYRYAILPYEGYSLHSYSLHRGYGGTAHRSWVHRQAVEHDRPFYVLPFTGLGGAAPLAGSAVDWPAVEDAVTVQALFPQDGQVFLRLCNMGATPLSVPLATPVEAINLALTERTPAPAPLRLHPWRVQTYRIK